jgi:hypothetical protein
MRAEDCDEDTREQLNRRTMVLDVLYFLRAAEDKALLFISTEGRR